MSVHAEPTAWGHISLGRHGSAASDVARHNTWNCMVGISATSGAITLAAPPAKTQRACVFGDASALATSPGKYKDFNAESLTQTPAVSPVRQLSLLM
jgi:hypothetical protein